MSESSKIFLHAERSQISGIPTYKRGIKTPTEEIGSNRSNRYTHESETTKKIHWDDKFLSQYLGEEEPHTCTANIISSRNEQIKGFK